MEIIKVKSKQDDLKVRHSKPDFEYTFESKAVEMPLEHADILIKNPNFEKVGKSKKVKINMDLNGDGKVDKKDVSIAGKVLANSRKIKESE